MRRIPITGLLLLVGCGPELLEPAELGEVCGHESPFRVLELPPDEIVGPRPQLLDDRLYYQVHPLNEPYSGSAHSPYSHVQSSGPCGESPRLLDPSVARVFKLDHWPDLLLGVQRETGDILVVDPDAVTPPHVVFDEVGWDTYQTWTDHGLVSTRAINDETGAVYLSRWPADPHSDTASPGLIYGPVSIVAQDGDVFSVRLRALGDALWVTSQAGDLERVDLADGGIDVEQPDVRDFEISPDERHLLWQDLEITRDDPYRPLGKVYLRDRDTGTDTFLTEGVTAWADVFDPTADGEFVICAGPGDVGPLRIYTLPALTYTELPQGRRRRAELADGRWLLGGLWPSGPLELYDPDDGTRATLMSDERIDVLAVHADGVEVLVDRSDYYPSYGELVYVPFDGSPQRTLLTDYRPEAQHLDDGRRISVHGPDAAHLGTLALVDPWTQTRKSIDERVFDSRPPFSVPGLDDDVIAYSVSDGDRSGVWLARVPGL